MEAALKFKALAGVTQLLNGGDGIDDDIKAVVTYQRNIITSDRFVPTHVSLVSM